MVPPFVLWFHSWNLENSNVCLGFRAWFTSSMWTFGAQVWEFWATVEHWCKGISPGEAIPGCHHHCISHNHPSCHEPPRTLTRVSSCWLPPRAGVDFVTLVLAPHSLVTSLAMSWHRVCCIPNTAHYPEPEPNTCATQASLTWTLSPAYFGTFLLKVVPHLVLRHACLLCSHLTSRFSCLV